MEPARRLLQLLEKLRNLKIMDMPKVHPDLTISQIHLIQTIHNMPGSRIQDLSERLNLSAPTISVAVKKLEDEDWVLRLEHPNDGRAFSISLTEKSLRTFKKFKEAQLASMNNFFSGLTNEEQYILVDLFEKAFKAAERDK